MNDVKWGSAGDVADISFKDSNGCACTLYLFRPTDKVRGIHVNELSRVLSLHTDEELEEILKRYNLIDKVPVDEIMTFLGVTE